MAHTLQNHPELATKTTGGEKLLRSGELARLKEAGCIELMGSRGSQVLLRGFRLELSEIESLLCARPDVLHCVVVPTVDWQGETTLDVFLTCQGVRKPTQWELRDYLGHYIPEFMTPSIYRILDHFPLTEDGRPDRTLIAGMVKPVR